MLGKGWNIHFHIIYTCSDCDSGRIVRPVSVMATLLSLPWNNDYVSLSLRHEENMLHT